MPRALTPRRALQLLSEAFPEPPVVLSAGGYLETVQRIGDAGIPGEAIYDALMAATAVEAGVRLLTSGRRAAATYALVGAGCPIPPPDLDHSGGLGPQRLSSVLMYCPASLCFRAKSSVYVSKYSLPGLGTMTSSTPSRGASWRKLGTPVDLAHKP
jgi:hypothetical protein